jgi:hypothetical protein
VERLCQPLCLPGFAAFLAGEGGAEHDRLRGEAEASGVFGVPTFVFNGVKRRSESG